MTDAWNFFIYFVTFVNSVIIDTSSGIYGCMSPISVTENRIDRKKNEGVRANEAHRFTAPRAQFSLLPLQL